jgi:hypothetical protein
MPPSDDLYDVRTSYGWASIVIVMVLLFGIAVLAYDSLTRLPLRINDMRREAEAALEHRRVAAVGRSIDEESRGAIELAQRLGARTSHGQRIDARSSSNVGRREGRSTGAASATGNSDREIGLAEGDQSQAMLLQSGPQGGV